MAILKWLACCLFVMNSRVAVAWPYGKEIPPLPLSWQRSTVPVDMATAYFVGNDTGMNSVAELAAEARWGIIGIGWQLNGSVVPHKGHVFANHVEIAERQTATALKARNPKLKVLLGRNTETANQALDSVAAVWNRTDFWLKCGESVPQADCVSGWGSWGNKKFFDFSQPALREWYLGIYLNSSLFDPLFDGAFFDCACGHPKNASAGGDAAYQAGFQQVWAQYNEMLVEEGRWGTAWAGPNVLNPVPNPQGSRSQQVCKYLLPKVIELGQANGTAQFTWEGNMLGHNPDASDNFTLYLAAYLLGKGESSTLTAHVTGGYDATILDQSGFTNNSALLAMDYGEPLELGACVGGSAERGRSCPSLTWARRLSKSSVVIRCDNATGAGTAWITMNPPHHNNKLAV
jgi:hypothetical protein